MIFCSSMLMYYTEEQTMKNITFSYTMFHDIFLEVENVADNLSVEQSEYPQRNILLLWLCETANWMNKLRKLCVNVGFGG